MKLILLAGGYGTHLYPLTLTQPKALLEVAGKLIIERVLENLTTIPEISEILVVTNAQYTRAFEAWQRAYARTHPAISITIVNDGSPEEATRLGAIGDLRYAIEKQRLEEDLMVVGGDNLFSQSLESFGAYCRDIQSTVLGVYGLGRLEQAKKYSAVHTNMEGQITSFEEKPERPSTTLIGIALYYYPRSVLPRVAQYLDQGNSPEEPGRLIQWLYPRIPVFTWSVPGVWFDIGSQETLEEANRIFADF